LADVAVPEPDLEDGELPDISAAPAAAVLQTPPLQLETIQGVDMEGVALKTLATRDWVDWTTTVTNDVIATAEVLGMVAARAVLFAELDKVVSGEGGYVDSRHLAQLVTTMTQRGFVMALSRHGINRTDYSVLQRASFEEPVDHLQAAAAAGTVDPLRGLSESITMGVKAPLGTGTVAVQEDIDTDAPARRFEERTIGSRELQGLPGAAKRFRVVNGPNDPRRIKLKSNSSEFLERFHGARAQLRSADFVIVVTGPNGAEVAAEGGVIVPPPLPPLPLAPLTLAPAPAPAPAPATAIAPPTTPVVCPPTPVRMASPVF
jgi:hypothetical protein